LYALRGSPIWLLTRLAGAGVVGVMIVAWVTGYLRSGFFTFRPGEAWEYVMVLTVPGVVVAGLGAGAWSLDHAVGIFENPSVGGLAIALVVSGGAAALLAACWWPPRREPA
jgi:putative oxidoreductase